MTVLNDIFEQLIKLTGQTIADNEQKLKENLEDNNFFNQGGLGYSQFNELLLTLGYDRVTKDFFKCFFGDEAEIASLENLEQGVEKFRKAAMLLTAHEDLKIAQDMVSEKGQVISDRTSERTKLQAKKQRLEDSLTRARLPLKELKPVPEPKFQTELAALKQARFNLDAIVEQINNFDQKFYHKDPWHVQVFESEKVQQLADLKRQELAASINVEKATSEAVAAHAPPLWMKLNSITFVSSTNTR